MPATGLIIAFCTAGKSYGLTQVLRAGHALARCKFSIGRIGPGADTWHRFRRLRFSWWNGLGLSLVLGRRPRRTWPVRTGLGSCHELGEPACHPRYDEIFRRRGQVNRFLNRWHSLTAHRASRHSTGDRGLDIIDRFPLMAMRAS